MCEAACETGWGLCEAKQFISRTDCDATYAQCKSSCNQVLYNGFVEPVCMTAITMAMKDGLSSCNKSLPGPICTEFCATTTLSIGAAVIAAGLGPEDIAADGFAAWASAEWGESCEVACVEAVTGSCAALNVGGYLSEASRSAIEISAAKRVCDKIV